MDVDLDLVAGGDNYGEVLFNVITWAQSEGRIDELLEKALAEKPGNLDLKRFVEQFRAQEAKAVPGALDLSSWVTVHDSGAEGTVAAMATVTAMETSLARQGDPELLSTRWLYWKAKQHDELQDAEGTFLTTVIYCAEPFGIPLESACTLPATRALPLAASTAAPTTSTPSGSTRSTPFRINSASAAPSWSALAFTTRAGSATRRPPRGESGFRRRTHGSWVSTH
jgi:hypothetical protein